MKVLQNLHKFRVRVWTSYRTHRCSRHWYGSLTELAQVPGRYTMLYPYPYPYPGIFTRATCTPGIVPRAYRTYRNSRCGYVYRTELTEHPVRVIPGRTHRVWFCTYPTEHDLGKIVRGINHHTGVSNTTERHQDHREASKITERHQRSQRHQRSKRGFTNQYWNRGITGQRGTIVSQILEGIKASRIIEGYQIAYVERCQTA